MSKFIFNKYFFMILGICTLLIFSKIELDKNEIISNRINDIKKSDEVIKANNMRPLAYECYTGVCFIDFKWLDIETDTEKVSRFYLFNTNEKYNLTIIVRERPNYAYNVYFKRIEGKSVIVMAELIHPNNNGTREYLF